MKVPVLESIFLNRTPLPDERDFNRVLVLSGAFAGSELVARLSLAGFDVLLMNDSTQDGSAGLGFSPHEFALEEVQGFIGGFEVTIRRDDERLKERVGFVVAAGDAKKRPKFSEYGLVPADRVMSISDLERRLRSGESLSGSGQRWFHAAFLCGLAGESRPSEFARVLTAMDELRAHGMVQTYVFTRQVKVAAWGMEKRYREARERGTIFFKFDGPGPVFESGDHGPVMVFTDPVLGQEMELDPDLLVVDEAVEPPGSLKPMLAAIPATAVTGGYLQPESTRFTGAATPKAGILALGPARGNFEPDTYPADAEAVLAALEHPEPLPFPSDFPNPPQIDLAACTMCLTCVRLCPHGAMSFRDRAYADPMSCVRCGICAAECPMNAITLEPAAGQRDVITRISEGMKNFGPDKCIVALLCSRSAANAMRATGPEVCRNLAPIVVPCAGTIDSAHILAAFQEGAGAVLVAGCHSGNCASVYGTVLARERSVLAGLALAEAGIDPELLAYVTVASNTPGDFARAVGRLQKKME